MTDGPDQPDWIEVGGTIYDCGVCGHSFLERVFVYPETADEDSWMACPTCGYEDRTADGPEVHSEWYHNRYSE